MTRLPIEVDGNPLTRVQLHCYAQTHMLSTIAEVLGELVAASETMEHRAEALTRLRNSLDVAQKIISEDDDEG